MLRQLFSGAGHFLHGFSLITKPHIRRYVLIPLSINVILFAGVTWFVLGNISGWTAQLLPDWLEWLNWILVPITSLLVLVIAFFSFSIIGNIIASPFNSYLSAAVEAHLTGEKIEETAYGSMIRGAARSLLNELRKLLYFILWAVPVIILSFIPVLNILALAITAWLLSLEYVDYPFANHSRNFAAVRNQLSRHRAGALGFGSMVMFMTSIPLINMLVMPTAVAGATSMYVRSLADNP